MIKKLSGNKAFVLLIVAFGLFFAYWYAIRPAQIKHECYQKTIKAIKDTKTAGGMNVFYEFCLHDKGL